MPLPPQKSQGDKRINHAIRASQVMVIDEEGQNLGQMSLTAAIEMAESQEVDLVEVGERDGIPLTKIMDYGKYLYKQQKQLAHNRANARKADLKTIQITYRMADHDSEIRRQQAIRFAEDRHPLRVTLRLRGRENQYVALAETKIKEFITSLQDVYKLDGSLSKAGTTFSASLTPKN